MKARRLLRRASVLAPNVTVRSRLPWPVTVLLVAVVLGLAAAAALWAFEEGRRLTGPHDADLRAMNRELTARLAARFYASACFAVGFGGTADLGEGAP